MRDRSEHGRLIIMEQNNVFKFKSEYQKRYTSKYIDLEYVALADLSYRGMITQRSIKEQADKILYQSLERFDLITYGDVYKDGKWIDWGWALNENGQSVLAAVRPYNYGCKCEHSVRLFCVCRERTYCPNPDHTGNGCHGSHD